MKRKINEQITIEYNECDADYIDIIIQHFIDNYLRIMKLFDLEKLDKNLNIKIYNKSEIFKNELEKKTGNKIPFWVVGSSKNNKNDTYSSIDCLSLLEVKR